MRWLPLLLVLAACDSSSETVVLTAETAVLDASGPALTLYALAEGRVVPTDSAGTSLTWDLGVRGTEIVLNGGASGPGAGVGAVVDSAFAAVEAVAIEGVALRRDGESACASGAARAVCAAPGDPTSPYTVTAGTVEADDARTLVLRTGDGQGWAKVRVTDYAADDPGAPETAGTVTIEYLVNPVGRGLVAGEEVTL